MVETITAEDLVRLPNHQGQLLETYEASMYREFDRWNNLYRRQTTLTVEEKQVFTSSLIQMCGDLTNILDFLEWLGKSLSDHYGEVRFLCRKIPEM